jgi:hypothetical protein
MSPIQVLIEATLLKADHKQKSRRVRALEYICSQNIPPADSGRFFVDTADCRARPPGSSAEEEADASRWGLERLVSTSGLGD